MSLPVMLSSLCCYGYLISFDSSTGVIQGIPTEEKAKERGKTTEEREKDREKKAKERETQRQRERELCVNISPIMQYHTG